MSDPACSCRAPMDVQELFFDSVLHPRRPAPAHRDFLYVLRTNAESLPDATVNSPVPARVLEFRTDTGKINRGIERHCESEHSSRFHSKSRNFYVPRKISGNLAERIRALRESLGMNQTAFARKLGTQPSAVSKWESGRNRPVPDIFVQMAKLSEGSERLYFLDLAGVPDAFFEGAPMTGEMLHAATQLVARVLPGHQGSDTFVPLAGTKEAISVPVINPTFVGTRNAVDNVESLLPLPSVWIPKTGTIQAARFSNPGSSLIEGDLIGLIDITRRDEDRLVGCTVAVRTEAGLEAMRLRRDGAQYLLVPFTADAAPRMLRDGERSIVGRIIKWIADAPSAQPEKRARPKRKAS